MLANIYFCSRDWADDDEYEDPTALPKDSTTINKDGTKTVITYSINEAGKKVKTTRRIRTTVIREKVNPRVAERRGWSKFGLEKGHGAGPQSETTSVGENILFKPSITWRKDGKDEVKKEEEESVKDKLRDKKVRCRICEGEHFTARCPFKDTMAPAGEDSQAEGAGAGGGPGEIDDAGRLGTGSGGYVPPHLRKGGATMEGSRMGGGGGGKFERDDLATLRVTNVSLALLDMGLHCANTLRYRNLPKSKTFVKCLKDSAELPGYS